MICGKLDLQDFRLRAVSRKSAGKNPNEQGRREASGEASCASAQLAVSPLATARSFTFLMCRSSSKRVTARSLEKLFFNANLSQRALVFDKLEISEITVVIQ